MKSSFLQMDGMKAVHSPSAGLNTRLSKEKWRPWGRPGMVYKSAAIR